MKRNQIVILVIALVIAALIYIRLRANQPDSIDEKKAGNTELFVPVRVVKNELKNQQIVSYGQISPLVEIDIAFEIQGRLKQGSLNLKPGVHFSAGQLLYSVDVEETKQTLSARRTSFANLIIGSLAELEMDYPQAANKWIDYLNKIQPTSTLPELPAFNSGKERMFMTSRNIISEYYNIKSLEERYKKYSYMAPWSGTVVDVISEPGSIINPGVKIARIAKVGDFEVKVPISLTQLDMFKSKGVSTFTDSKGEKVGTGKIVRISDVINQKTQSVDVYYSIKAFPDARIYNGMFVNAEIKQMATIESMAIPRMAVKDNKVLVLENTQLKTRLIEIVNTKPDTVFVKGLKDGETVLLEQVQSAQKVTKYKGIKR